MAKSHTIVIDQTDETFAVGADEFILDAALKADISYPRYCRTGVCGSCKSVLVSGAVEHDTHTQVALSDEEKGLRRILACRARPTADCRIAFIPRDVVARFTNATRAANGRVESVDWATKDVAIVRVATEGADPFVFTAGQYANVAFDGLEPRDLSMASRPGERSLEFHIRCVPGSDIGDYAKQGRLKPGVAVAIKGPGGNAYLREYHGTDIIAVAGGTGVAPIKSIIDMAITAGIRQTIELYYGVRTAADVYLEDHFRDLAAKFPNLKFHLVLSEGKAGKGRRSGLVSDALAEDLAPGRNVRIYIAGPPPMVEATLKVVDKVGIRRKNCFADYFEQQRAQRA